MLKIQSCGQTLNQCEQDIAMNYCQHHELVRPNTNLTRFVMWVLFIEITSITLSYVLHEVLHWFSIVFSFGTLYYIISPIVFLIFLKKICVLLIELYQHYASEKTRRKCVMMPSCSEYALLVLEKYNVFKGLYKTYTRMTTKCKGSYKIDYP